MNKRIEWIDISKGFGIFLVIIGHTMLEPDLRSQIYSFHMPLFFLISGFLFSNKKYHNLAGFALAKARSLLIPYFTFSLISLFLGKILLGSEINPAAVSRLFLFSRRNDLYFDEPLWFLTSLFTLEIIFYFFVKYVKSSLKIMLLATVLSILAIGVFDALTAVNVLPWSLDQSLYYIFYFALGYVMKKANLLSANGKKSPILILSSVIYVYLIVDDTILTKLFQHVSEIPYLPDSAVLFLNNVIWAMLAIFFVFYISQFITFSFIKFLGENSLILLALHVSLGFNLTNRIASGPLAEFITNPNLLGLVYTIAAIVIVSPVAVIIKKFFPFIIGRGYGKVNKKQSKPSVAGSK